MASGEAQTICLSSKRRNLTPKMSEASKKSDLLQNPNTRRGITEESAYVWRDSSLENIFQTGSLSGKDLNFFLPHRHTLRKCVLIGSSLRANCDDSRVPLPTETDRGSSQLGFGNNLSSANRISRRSSRTSGPRKTIKLMSKLSLLCPCLCLFLRRPDIREYSELCARGRRC